MLSHKLIHNVRYASTVSNAILQRLGLDEKATNHGVFSNGSWKAGNAGITKSINPCNNSTIAAVSHVSSSVPFG